MRPSWSDSLGRSSNELHLVLTHQPQENCQQAITKGGWVAPFGRARTILPSPTFDRDDDGRGCLAGGKLHQAVACQFSLESNI